jgi:hypothetical protein
MVAPVVFVLGEFSIILAGCSGGRTSRLFLELGRESFSWSGFAIFTAIGTKFGLLAPNRRCQANFPLSPPLPLSLSLSPPPPLSPSPPLPLYPSSTILQFLTRIFYLLEMASDG